MMKIIFTRNFLLIFAFVFLIPAIILGVILFKTPNYENIITNGIETKAEVIPNSAKSNVEVNGINYYYVEFQFTIDELTYKGKTTSSYTIHEAVELEEIGVIRIKYDPKTFESVEADYNPSLDKGGTTTLILFIAFGLADLILWIISAIRIYINYTADKIIKHGIEYTAVVNNIGSAIVENRVPKYYIEYSWQNELGETISNKSPSIYNEQQAFEMKNAKYIIIRTIGKKSVIMDIKHSISLQERMDINIRD